MCVCECVCVGGVGGERLVQSSGPEKNKKMEEVQIHPLLELDVPSSFALGHQSSWFLGLQTLVLTYWLPWFLGL